MPFALVSYKAAEEKREVELKAAKAEAEAAAKAAAKAEEDAKKSAVASSASAAKVAEQTISNCPPHCGLIRCRETIALHASICP